MLFMVHSHHCSISKGKWPSTTSYTRWNNLWNSTDKNEKQHWFKLISLKPFSDHMHVYLQCLSFSTISKWQQFNSNLIVKKRTRSQSSIATKRGSMVQSYCQGKLTVWLRFTQTTLWISSATTRMLWVISKSEASHVDLNRADSSTESCYPCTSLRGITTEQYQLGVVHKYMRKWQMWKSAKFEAG